MRIVSATTLMVIGTIGLMTVAASPSAAPPSRCLPGDTLTASRLVWLKAVVTRTDSQMVTVRAGMQLLATQASKVKLVTSSTVCGRLADSLDVYRNQAVSGRAVYAYEIGPSRLGVEDPADTSLKNGERVFGIYSSTYQALTATAVPPWVMDQFEWDPIRP